MPSDPWNDRHVELELDGEPRNREIAREESPHATRWRVGEQHVVGDLDPATGIVHVRIGPRTVGEIPALGGSVRFTLAAGSGYRGGDQVEARIHCDARTENLTLWVDGIEVAPIARPQPAPMSAPVAAPPPRFVPLPPPSDAGGARPWLRGVLVVALVAFIGVPTYLYVRERDGNATADLQAKTAACLRRADVQAEAARARLGNDPKVDDQRRLARISCKQHEIECKRDPRGLVCLMDPK